MCDFRRPGLAGQVGETLGCHVEMYVSFHIPTRFLLEMIDKHTGFVLEGSTEHLPKAVRAKDLKASA